LKIKELDNKDPKEYQLKVIKKTKCKPKEGDIFLVSPREGIYFYGRVFKAEIKHIANDTFINGKNAVFIFKCKTRTLDLSNYLPNYEELIIDPVIVDDIYWRKGFFIQSLIFQLMIMKKNLTMGSTVLEKVNTSKKMAMNLCINHKFLEHMESQQLLELLAILKKS